METALSQLANLHAQIVLDAEQLRNLIEEDRAKTWMDGVQVGMRMRAAKQLTDMETPISIEDAATAIGVSKSSIRTLIDNGEIRTINYPGINRILIAQEEIRRFKERNTDSRIKQPIKD